MAGRKPIEINLREVERLGGLGLNEQQICDHLGISNRTLERRKINGDFVEALKRGEQRANSQVANWLFKNCKQGNVTAQIWWEKTRAGFSEKLTLEGNQEKPIVLAAVDRPDSITSFAPGSVGDRN